MAKTAWLFTREVYKHEDAITLVLHSYAPLWVFPGTVKGKADADACAIDAVDYLRRRHGGEMLEHHIPGESRYWCCYEASNGAKYRQVFVVREVAAGARFNRQFRGVWADDSVGGE